MHCVQCLFYILLIVPAMELKKINPVIIIPGLGGSQVEAKLDKVEGPPGCSLKYNFYNIWLNPIIMASPVVVKGSGAVCFADNMRLIYDKNSHKTSSPPGVQTRIPGWGDPAVVDDIDPNLGDRNNTISNSSFKYYSDENNFLTDFFRFGRQFIDISDALVKLGWERNVSIRGAPYDFRKAPDENQKFFVDLKTLVEETYKTNDNTPVWLLVHSMGGPMSLHFLHQQSQQWKDQHIKGLVSLAGAWGGSVKSIKVYAIGDPIGNIPKILPSIIRDPIFDFYGAVFRRFLISMPSNAWLVPSSLFWKNDEVLVETSTKNYTLNNLKDFFKDINFEDGWEMFQNVKPYTQNFSAPGVEVHCLYGDNVDTLERLVYNADPIPQPRPELVMGDGDGTVNKRSLEGCLRWEGKQKQPVHHQSFSKVDHTGILSNKEVIGYITQLFVSKL